MALANIVAVFAAVALVGSTPAPNPTFWKGTPFDTTVEEMRSLCNKNDAIACIQFKAVSFLDNLFQKDTYKVSDDVEINRNSYRSNEVTSRSEMTLDKTIEEYVKSHDVTFSLPMLESKVTLGARNLDNDELDVKLSFSDSSEGRRRKSKLKKIFVPILIFVLLKAMTLIPLALGILGLKAWNALQLSFFSFVVSVGLAIFQLCKKLANDNAHPQISAHSGWDPSYGRQFAARSMDVSTEAQNLAYSAYL